MIRERIEEKLRAAFQPVFLEVVDESYRHNVPAGSESHFKVVLVSDRFTGERFVLSGFCAFCPAFRRKSPGNCEKIRDSAQ